MSAIIVSIITLGFIAVGTCAAFTFTGHPWMALVAVVLSIASLPPKLPWRHTTPPDKDKQP